MSDDFVRFANILLLALVLFVNLTTCQYVERLSDDHHDLSREISRVESEVKYND